MPMLTLGGVTVPVRIDPVEGEVMHAGDETEAYDLTPLTRRRATKRRWQVSTIWLAVATADTLEAVLEGTQPVAATGDLTGSINVVTTLQRDVMRTASGGVRMRLLEFVMQES